MTNPVKTLSKTHPVKWRLKLNAFSNVFTKKSPDMEPKMVQVESKVVQNWSKSGKNPYKIASETTSGGILSAFAPKSAHDHVVS